MIVEFTGGDDANLLEHELTRCSPDGDIITNWVAPGVFRLVAAQEVMRHVVEAHWAHLPDQPPAKLIASC